jgi:hypothetical protein
MTMIRWLGTTSILLTLGTAVAVAQAPQGPAQKRDESPRVQAPPSKDADRPAAGDKGASERAQDRAQQPEPKAGAKDERKQAEEPSSRDSRQPTQQSQDQKGRDGKQPADQKQQSQDQRNRAPSGTTSSSQQSKEDKQPAAQKQQQTRDEQQKQDNRTGQTTQPAESKQPAQAQPAQPAQAQPAQQQPGTGRASDTTQRRDSTSASANINDDQRTRIIDRLQRERTEAQTNVNIQVNIGARLPSDVRGRPLPPDIVQIVPQYRGHEYMVVREEIVIIEPGRREIVDVISRSGSASMASARVGSNRIVISSEQRETLKRAAMRTTGSTQSSGALDTNCLQLQAVPPELARDNPQLSSYRMLMIGDQIVLIDPEQRKVVEVVE